MKFSIPEISWHNRDPVLSVDFQPKTDDNGPTRLASGGTDSHVLIWYISSNDTGELNLEVAADLTRHQKAVNVVRWSPSGQYLASGDDESIIFIWKQKFEKEPISNLDQTDEQYKETWVIYKTLRGHMEDVLDLSWSPDSLHLASGSVDNKVLVWDINKGRYSCILSDHKGFVQGVSWDPKGQLIATASTDRTFRTFDVTTKKVTSRSSKAILPFPSGHELHNTMVRLYHDDTLQTYYRRLQFSPDGLLIAVPAGRIEPEQGKMDGKPINAVYIYTRYCLKRPVCVVQCGEAALAARWRPARLARREAGPAPALPLPAGARRVLAVATRRSVLLYDTQQAAPIALVANIHYTRLTDLTWSPDGLMLVASSTDGFCSVITFSPGDLGEELPEDPPTPHHVPATMEVDNEEPQAEIVKEKSILTPKAKSKESKSSEMTQESKSKEKPQESKTKEKTQEPKSTTPKIDSFIKFKAPSKSPKTQKSEVQPKTPVKIDVLEEVAMSSWSDNSSNEIIRPKENEKLQVDNPEIMVIEDSEDVKLVYEVTQEAKSSPPTPESPKTCSSVSSENTFMKSAKITDVKEAVQVKSVPSPKAPRRVNFVTLSSPKNKKKK